MIYIQRILQVLCVVLLAHNVHAQSDFLSPVGFMFEDNGEYKNSVFTRLLENEKFYANVCAYSFIFPSFKPEYAVFLECDEATYSAMFHGRSNSSENPPQFKIVLVRLKKSVWHSGTPKEGLFVFSSAKAGKIETERSERAVSAKIGMNILKAFVPAARSARYPDKASRGWDGTSYYFGARDNDIFLFVHTWSPRDMESAAYNMVQLAAAMERYAADASISDSDFSQEIDGLAVKLVRQKKCAAR